MKQLTTKYIKQFMPLLKQTFLFDNCTDTDVYHIVECLCGYVKKYQKNQIIYNLYDNIEYAGVVLSGEINAYSGLRCQETGCWFLKIVLKSLS